MTDMKENPVAPPNAKGGLLIAILGIVLLGTFYLSFLALPLCLTAWILGAKAVNRARRMGVGAGGAAIAAKVMGALGTVFAGVSLVLAGVFLAVAAQVPRDMRESAVAEFQMQNTGPSYEEIFNTRLAAWRSAKVFQTVVQEYRSCNPASMATDEEIAALLAASQLELRRNSRIITVTVRARSALLAASLANAYVRAIETYTDEANRIRCDKAVRQIHENVEKKRREVEDLARRLLEFRTANKLDSLRSSCDTIRQSLSKTTGDILALEGEETQLVAWEKMLETVKDAPERFGSLSTSVPRAQEISTEYRAFQDAAEAYRKMLFTFTENHPDVVARAKELAIARQRFADAAQRARESGRAALRLARDNLANLRATRENLKNDLASCEQRIASAESGLGILEADFGVANRVLEELILAENKARLDAEADNEIIEIVSPANVTGSGRR